MANPEQDSLHDSRGPGFCMQNAMVDAGYPLEEAMQVPEWVDKDTLRSILHRLRIRAFWDSVELSSEESAIVIYKTDEDDEGNAIGHAQFYPRLGDFPVEERTIFGIIPKWKKFRSRKRFKGMR